MENQVVEGIAAEDKLTRDRRLALKEQKKAIEEAKSLCASLAMRSELRGFDGNLEDEGQESEDEEDTRRYSNTSSAAVAAAAAAYQRAKTQESVPLQREPRGYALDSRQVNGNYSQQQQQQPQAQQYQQQQQQQQQQQRPPSQQSQQQQQPPIQTRGQNLSRADSQRMSSEWAQNYYSTSGDHNAAPQAPVSAPPPPPRPPKADDDDRYADTPRSSYQGHSPSRHESKRESTRHRLNILGR